MIKRSRSNQFQIKSKFTKWKILSSPPVVQSLVVANSIDDRARMCSVDQGLQLGKKWIWFFTLVNRSFVVWVHGKIYSKFHKRKNSLSRNLSSARPMSTRPPSALTGGTASRLTSAMHQSTVTPSQRIGTAIGFADNVSQQFRKNAKFATFE